MEQQQESSFIQGKILRSWIIFALQDLLVIRNRHIE